MWIALALTVVALASALAGVLLEWSSEFSSHLSAAGGGLLFGIALFWLLPEMAEPYGWGLACSSALVAFAAIALFDRVLVHAGRSPRQGVVAPVLIATALHSFVDGWSVRMFSGQQVANVAVPLGLALHKVPEGLAIGWLSRRSMRSVARAAAASLAVEALTFVGAVVQPRANSQAMADFGASWETVVLAIIAGTFCYLGVHAILPDRRKLGVVAVFFLTLGTVGITAVVGRR
jgi:zinc transporter ZupT